MARSFLLGSARSVLTSPRPVAKVFEVAEQAYQDLPFGFVRVDLEPPEAAQVFVASEVVLELNSSLLLPSVPASAVVVVAVVVPVVVAVETPRLRVPSPPPASGCRLLAHKIEPRRSPSSLRPRRLRAS